MDLHVITDPEENSCFPKNLVFPDSASYFMFVVALLLIVYVFKGRYFSD